jgi:hypothetical protein
MPRLQDILFGIFGIVLIGLLAFDVRVGVLALLGAFGCGSIYIFAGMLPARSESFWERAFVSTFLSLVMSSLVLIVPGTLGMPRPGMRTAVIAIAGLLPVAAICFEVLRTPRVIRGILWCLGYR